MVEGVDYSFSRPGGAALAAAGKHFAVRYLSHSSKGLTQTEIKDLTAHGIAVVLVFEEQGGSSLGGFVRGVADAHAAIVSQPPGLTSPTLPIYFAVDFDATSAQLPVVHDYFKGVASVLGARTGVYGSYAVINYCKDVAPWLWQTYAWSGSKVANGIHLYQYKNGQTINGASVDLCRAWQDNYGQNSVITSIPPSTTKVSPMFNPAEPMVAIGRFRAADGTVVALGVKDDGSVFCEPSTYYRGGANGQAFFTGRHAALIQDNGQDGYQIVDTAGEKYSFPEGTHPV